MKIAVLISGRGSNLQALIDAAATEGFPAEIACVISNKPDVQGLERARQANISALTLNHKDFADREAFEHALDKMLVERGVQLVCLAGFMRLLTAWFTERWRDKLINIHPSLLPAFPGLDTHQKAIDYGVKFAGCTIHFVRTEMDHGPIISQAAVPVLPNDDEDSLAARILGAEHTLYPQVVSWIAEGRVNVINERVFVASALGPQGPFINPVGANSEDE